MMVRFINRISGAEMMVASDRVEEYKRQGHILAADLGTKPVKKTPIKPEEPEKPVEDPVEDPVETPAPAVNKRLGKRKK